MMTKNIPADIQQQALASIDKFNQQKLNGHSEYRPRFKGKFLYIDRADHGRQAVGVCRLKFTGSIDDWDFAIFKFSSNAYDSDEWFMPGAEHIDGTIEGAMLCGMAAYPA
jgi:hypothetical protein